MFVRSVFFTFLIVVVARLGVSPGRAADIPFRFENGMIWVKVAIAGHDRPLDFLLDSGASATVVDLQTAHDLGLKLGDAQAIQGVHARGTAYRVSRFEGSAGGNPLPATPLAIDLSPVSAGCSHKIDGLLGADFFRGHIVLVDFAASRVRLLSSAQSTAGEVLPISLRSGAICISASVGDRSPAWMRVDTGCNSAVEFAPASGGLAGVRGESIAVAPKLVSNVRDTVQLGSVRMEEIKVGMHAKPIFPGESGLLGAGLLSRFKSVTFDMVSRRLILVKI